jgi:hypothetical protein
MCAVAGKPAPLEGWKRIFHCVRNDSSVLGMKILFWESNLLGLRCLGGPVRGWGGLTVEIG